MDGMISPGVIYRHAAIYKAVKNRFVPGLPI